MISVDEILLQPIVFKVATHPYITDFHQCMTPDFISADGQFYAAVYGLVSLIPLYFIPLAVIVFCYSQIYFIVLHRANDPHIGTVGRKSFKNRESHGFLLKH